MTITGTTPGTIALYVFAFVFFIVLPNAMLLFTLLLLGSPELSYLTMLAAVVCVPCDIALVYFLIKRKRDKKLTARRMGLLAGKYTPRQDRVLSAIRSEEEAFTTEVCLDRTGTIKLTGEALQQRLLAAAVIQRNTGSSMGIVHGIVSAVSGLLALRAAERLMTIFRFRKLQKAYQKPEYWERLIEGEAYRMLYEQRKNEQQAEA